MKIALVLPVFNEQNRVREVLSQLNKTPYSLYVVNDGSTDSSADIIKKAIEKNPRAILISHRINLGKGSAIRTGSEAAFETGHDAVIMMDSDGQHSPEDISKFITKLELRKYDIVLGSRNLHHGVPLIRFLGNKFASVLIALLFGIYVSDILSGFRAITKKSFNKLKLESTGYGIETEIIVKISKYKMSYCEIPVETIYHDKNKGVTVLDSLSILLDVFRWRLYL